MVFLLLGPLLLLYVMLKLFRNKGEQIKLSKTTSDSEESKEVNLPTDKKIEETDGTSVAPLTLEHKLVNSDTEDKMAITSFRPKPNFFVAFQVNDTGIHKNVKKLQEKLIAKNPLLFPAIVNVSTLHVTLAVTRLPGEKDITTIKEKLDEWAEKNLKTYFDKPCILNFTGVKTFDRMVAYVELEKCENYKKIKDISENINNVLSSAGYSFDKRGFTPHLTFLKLSKDFRLIKLKKKFIKDFDELKESREHFGRQEVTHIQLLSMDSPKDEFGYYKCFHQIKVSDAKQDMDHSECCTPIPKPKLSKES